MIHVRKSTPSFHHQSTTNKTVFGLPAVFLGLALSLGLGGNAALGSCVCDEQVLGKDYCDQFLRTCQGPGGYVPKLEAGRQKVDNYGWDVCNESSGTVYAAYASAYEGYGYTRKGWYTISPGSCKRVITESMADKNYYTRIERSNGSSLTKQERSFCMWPPQSNGQVYTASFKKCRHEWKVKSDKSFDRMPKATGFTSTVR